MSKSVIKRIGILLLALTIFIPIPALAQDDVGFYDNPNSAIQMEAQNSMISVTSEDVAGFQAVSNWLNGKKSYIFVKNTGGFVSYYFNAPNIQKNISNALQGVNIGGWRFSPYYIDPSESVPADQQTTAAKKYGYSFPSAVYLGEYPVVTINFTGIVEDATTPTNVARVVLSGIAETGVKAVKGLVAFFGINIGGDDPKTEFTAGLTPNAIKNMSYANVDYYNTAGDYIDAISKWVESNWEVWKADKDNVGVKLEDSNLFDDGVIVNANETVGSKDGQVSGKEIIGRIAKKAGASINAVIEGLNAYCKEKGLEEAPQSYIVRHMPYELDSMSSASKSYMHGVSDPRYDMFGNIGTLGIVGTTGRTIIHEMLSEPLLKSTGMFAKISAGLNSICDLKFLEANGINFAQFWEGAVGTFIVYAILIGAICFIIVGFFNSITTGGTGHKQIVGRAIMTALLAGLAVGLMVNPKGVSDVMIDTTSKILDVGTSTIGDDSFSKLYTEDASQADKSELRFWYMYFNVWTGYMTNHAVSEEANQFDVSQSTNEYYGLKESPAKLKGNKAVDLWSAVLLNSFYENDGRTPYRVSDHFLAPTIENGNYPEFTVKENKFFNGYICNEIPVGGFISSINVMLFTVIKVFCFIELVVDILLFMLKFVNGAFEGRAFFKDSIGAIGKDIFRVIAYDVIMSIFIYVTAVATGSSLTFIAVFESFFFFALIEYLSRHSTHIMCPGAFVVLDNVANRFKQAFANKAGFDGVSDNTNKQIEELNSLLNDSDEKEDKKDKVKEDADNGETTQEDYSDEDSDNSIDNKDEVDNGYNEIEPSGGEQYSEPDAGIEQDIPELDVNNQYAEENKETGFNNFSKQHGKISKDSLLDIKPKEDQEEISSSDLDTAKEHDKVKRPNRNFDDENDIKIDNDKGNL